VGTNIPKDLKPERDRHRPVASGDKLRCLGPNKIVVQQGDKAPLVINKGNGLVVIQRSAVLNSIAQDFDPAMTDE